MMTEKWRYISLDYTYLRINSPDRLKEGYCFFLMRFLYETRSFAHSVAGSASIAPRERHSAFRKYVFKLRKAWVIIPCGTYHLLPPSHPFILRQCLEMCTSTQKVKLSW